MMSSEKGSEIGVRMLLEPKVLVALLEDRAGSPLLRDGFYQLPSGHDTKSAIDSVNSYEEGGDMETAIGRLLMGAIAPKLQQLTGAGNVVLTLVAKKEG